MPIVDCVVQTEENDWCHVWRSTSCRLWLRRGAYMFF